MAEQVTVRFPYYDFNAYDGSAEIVVTVQIFAPEGFTVDPDVIAADIKAMVDAYTGVSVSNALKHSVTTGSF